MTNIEYARKNDVTRRQASKIQAGAMTLSEAQEVNFRLGRSNAADFPRKIGPMPARKNWHGFFEFVAGKQVWRVRGGKTKSDGGYEAYRARKSAKRARDQAYRQGSKGK